MLRKSIKFLILVSLCVSHSSAFLKFGACDNKCGYESSNYNFANSDYFHRCKDYCIKNQGINTPIEDGLEYPYLKDRNVLKMIEVLKRSKNINLKINGEKVDVKTFKKMTLKPNGITLEFTDKIVDINF